MQTFSFHPPINLIEEGKRLLPVTSFEATNSVFSVTNENNSFSKIIPGRWRIPNYLPEGTIDVLKLRSQNDIELHVEEVKKKRDNQIIIGDKGYKLSDLKKRYTRRIKGVKYHDLEYLAYRMQLTYNEIMDILDIKYFPSQITSYTLPPVIYEVFDLNDTLRYILPNNVKVSVTVDGVKLMFNLKINQTLISTEKSFFYTILGFTQSHCYPLHEIDGFYQLIAGSYKSEKTY